MCLWRLTRTHTTHKDNRQQTNDASMSSARLIIGKGTYGVVITGGMDERETFDDAEMQEAVWRPPPAGDDGLVTKFFKEEPYARQEHACNAFVERNVDPRHDFTASAGGLSCTRHPPECVARVIQCMKNDNNDDNKKSTSTFYISYRAEGTPLCKLPTMCTRRGNPLTLECVFPAFLDVLRGIERFTEARAIHGDLSSGNVLYDMSSARMRMVDLASARTFAEFEAGIWDSVFTEQYLFYPPELVLFAWATLPSRSLSRATFTILLRDRLSYMWRTDTDTATRSFSFSSFSFPQTPCGKTMRQNTEAYLCRLYDDCASLSSSSSFRGDMAAAAFRVLRREAEAAGAPPHACALLDVFSLGVCMHILATDMKQQGRVRDVQWCDSDVLPFAARLCHPIMRERLPVRAALPECRRIIAAMPDRVDLTHQGRDDADR